MYYLLGGSGIPNYGDELIAKGWLNFLAKRFPDERVVLECAVPSVSSLMLQPDNWRASHISIIKSLAESGNISGSTFWENVERGYKFFSKGGFDRHPRLKFVTDIFTQVKVFHMIGGGYMNEKWPQTGFLLGFAGALSKEFGIRVVGSGLARIIRDVVRFGGPRFSVPACM